MYISDKTFFENAVKSGVVTHFEDIDAIQFVFNGFRYLRYFSDYHQKYVCSRRNIKNF